MRPIDADELSRKIQDEYHRSYSEVQIAPYQIDRMIDAQPTIDAAPVVHAHWIDEGPFCSLVKCSQCGNFLDMGGVNAANFCPNCGARMDEEEENDTL